MEQPLIQLPEGYTIKRGFDVLDHENLLVPDRIKTEFHYPGANYMGPGTNVARRISNYSMPTSRADAIAILHDIDYLGAMNQFDLVKADNKAIGLASNSSLAEIAMKVGLSSRKFLHLPLQGQRPVDALILKNIIKNDHLYQSAFKKFKVDISDL